MRTYFPGVLVCSSAWVAGWLKGQKFILSQSWKPEMKAGQAPEGRRARRRLPSLWLAALLMGLDIKMQSGDTFLSSG